MSFNWAAVISKDIAFYPHSHGGKKPEMVVVNPGILTFLVHAYHDGVLYCVARDPDAEWTIDGVPIIEDRRVQSYEIK